VLITLLRNAINTSKISSVIVTTIKDETDKGMPYLHFFVQDQGMGFSTQQIKNLFDPIYADDY